MRPFGRRRWRGADGFWQNKSAKRLAMTCYSRTPTTPAGPQETRTTRTTMKRTRKTAKRARTRATMVREKRALTKRRASSQIALAIPNRGGYTVYILSESEAQSSC